MAKHRFVGDERVMSRWVAAFPDLLSFVADFTGSGRPPISPPSQVPGGPIEDTVVVVQDDESKAKALAEALLDKTEWVSIREFVRQQLILSQLMPGKLRVDASTFCQLECPSCYMRLHDYGSVGRGNLTFENFRNLIDGATYIHEIELSNSGEIFRNHDLIDIMQYAQQRRVRLTALNGVNFSRVSATQLEALVKYRFGSLMVSIDGASQETYSQYRVKGDFDRVIANIRQVNALKATYNSPDPQIIWQFIIMEHNEEDVPLAKAKASELGIPIWFKLTWDKDYIPRNRAMLERETGLLSLTRSEHLADNGKAYLGSTVCRQMFVGPQVNWDGKLLGCCEVFLSDYGVNVFEQGLTQALQSVDFGLAKKLLTGEIDARELPRRLPCLDCDKWLQMTAAGELVDPLEGLL